MRLSKSKFIAGWQCLKRLYWEVHATHPVPELDEQTKAVMEQGHEVGRWAQKRFPGGLLIEAQHEEMTKALQLTAQAVADKDCPAIYEATFTHENVLARVDVLERLPQNAWRLIEVKSSTSVKNYHVYDVAIQRLILESLGMTVVPCLMYLNRDYVYYGKEYDLERLFIIQDLTEETAAIAEEVKDLLRKEWQVLADGTPPDVNPGSHCSKPFTCEFFDFCNKSLPIDHIANIASISAKKLALLGSQGIESIGKIPPDFPLTERQKRVWECANAGKTWFGNGLKDSLAGLCYPLYFMDFETVGWALPRYVGTSPYDQVPFQWSVHVQRAPRAELEHFEFLADDSSDPRPEFLRNLCEVVGETGSVLAYNSGFESGCLDGLADAMPQYRDQIANIQGRLWDLLPVMRNHVYDLAFRGSYSLKRVLPALVTKMSYDGMAVAEGSDAGLAWEKMLRLDAGNEERRNLRKALLDYCAQDTLAMVRLLEVLRRAC